MTSTLQPRTADRFCRFLPGTVARAAQVAAATLLLVVPMSQPAQAETSATAPTTAVSTWVAVNEPQPMLMPAAAAWASVDPCARGCADLAAKVRRPSALPLLYAGLGVAQAMDLYSTSRAMSLGARESNPMMAKVVGNTGMSIMVKAATTAGVIYLAEKIRKKSPAAAVTMMIIANGVTAAVVAHNMRNVRILSSR